MGKLPHGKIIEKILVRGEKVDKNEKFLEETIDEMIKIFNFITKNRKLLRYSAIQKVYSVISQIIR